MAKRYTDTEKWNKSWYRKLGPRLRDIRQYVLDSCDHAGILDLDLETASHFVGSKVSLDDINKSFQGRIIHYQTDKIFIEDFIEYQYGALNPDNRVHKSVLAILKKEDPSKVHTRASGEAKDKEKDKDKEKAQEKDPEKKPKWVPPTAKDLEFMYLEYPRKEGKKKGLEKLVKVCQVQNQFYQVYDAITHYREYCALNHLEKNYIKHFDSFMSVWEDWVDPKMAKERLR